MKSIIICEKCKRARELRISEESELSYKEQTELGNALHDKREQENMNEVPKDRMK